MASEEADVAPSSRGADQRPSIVDRQDGADDVAVAKDVSRPTSTPADKAVKGAKARRSGGRRGVCGRGGGGEGAVPEP